MDVLQKLVRVVARSFYDDKTVLIFDTLIRETMAPEDVITERLHVVVRDFNRIVAKLQQDRLLKAEPRQQIRPSDQKPVNRIFLYIDYKSFVDVAKYRIYRMRQSVEEMIKKEFESKGYVCPGCGAFFGSLEVGRLVNPRTGLLECDVCEGIELESALGKDESAGSKQKHSNDLKDPDTPHALHARLMEQIRPIVELLKQADSVAIPAFSAQKWLEQNGNRFLNQGCMLYGITTSSGAPSPVEDALTIAGSASDSAAQVTVEIVDQYTPTLPAEQPATSTPLPEWHLYSTVTGEAIRGSASTRNPEAVDAGSQESLILQQEEAVSYYQETVREASTSQASTSASVNEPPKKSAKTDNVPMVRVAGELKALADITDNDKDRMTEDEYALYYEAYMSAN